MQNTADLISAEAIKPYLIFPCFAENIKVYPAVDSTNREAKEQAADGAVHGTVIIADRQTQGKGRFNRDFYSPPGSGLYMSFILFQNAMGFTSPTAVTVYAAVCACEAIEKACAVNPVIKWVNDLYLYGRKIAGILAEATYDSNNRGIDKIILGIGINISTKNEDFPEDIRQRAGSLCPEGHLPVSRNILAAGIINRILSPEKPKEPEIMKRYRKRLFMLGYDVIVSQGNERYKAKALDIDESGCLLVQREDGEILKLLSGEVSIQP